MSMNNALLFRSQLMQQFAAAARSQSRPPLALLSTTTSSTNTSNTNSSSTNSLVGNNATTSTIWQSNHPPSNPTSNNRRNLTSKNNPSVVVMNHPPSSPHTTNHSQQPTRKHNYSSDSLKHDDDHNDDHDEVSMSDLAKRFQSMIMTRRTISRFQPDQHSSSSSLSVTAAVERAIACAVQAPNHYRTEPVTFKRFAKDSNTAQSLMDICYQVAMKRQNSIELAQQKVDKWKTISSFVAVTVHPQPNQIIPITDSSNNDNIDTSYDDPYAPLPFHPPQTERQLEDYAAACASVQNLLLSLHSEGLGSKWATGPIIRCRAFRDLIQCRDDELIAGLIMIGEPWSANATMKQRRSKRSFSGDLLQDLD